MAKDLLKSVLELEEQCRSREAEAKKLADAKKQKAKDDSAKLISDARKSVEKMLEDDAAAVTKSADLRLEKEKLKFKTECESLSKKAEGNRERVTALVIDALTE